MRDTARADDGSVSCLGVALTLGRRLLANCVAASTSQVYGSGLNQCLTFCREVGIPHPFPLQEFVLELFVALWGTRLSVATLRTYLAGLPHFSFRFGFPTKVVGMHSLGFVLCGLQYSQVDRFTRPPRRPITVTTLILLRAYIRRHLPGSQRYHAPRCNLLCLLLACCALRDTAPLLSALRPGCPPAVQRSHSRPRMQGGEFAHHGVTDRSLLGGGGGAPCDSVPSACYTSGLAHTPLLPARCSHSGTGHTCPGQAWGTSSVRILPHRGPIICCGCHGLLLGHDPGPRAVAERLLQALRTAPLQICVPSPAPHFEVFGVTRGHSGPPPPPGSGWA